MLIQTLNTFTGLSKRMFIFFRHFFLRCKIKLSVQQAFQSAKITHAYNAKIPENLNIDLTKPLNPDEILFHRETIISELLSILRWHGPKRRITEAQPHDQDYLNLDELRQTLFHLGFESQIYKEEIADIHHHMIPALCFIDHEAYLLHEDKSPYSSYAVYFSDTNHVIEKNILFKNLTTQALLSIYTIEEQLKKKKQHQIEICTFFPRTTETTCLHHHWLESILTRFQPHAFRILGLGFLMSLLSTLSFLFIRMVYDWIMPLNTKAEEFFIYFLFGLGIVLLALEFIGSIQSKVLSYVGARLDMIIGTGVMNHILNLPLSQIERSSVAAQVTRIQQIDMIRETFTGPLAKLLTELPFIPIFLIIAGLLGGTLILVPLSLLIVFLGLAYLLYPILKETTNQVYATSQERKTFLLEVNSEAMPLKNFDTDNVWLNRFKEVAASLSIAQNRHENLLALARNLSQSLMKIAGLITIIWGSYQITENLLSTGEFMATLLLTWYALSPLQAGFMIMARGDQIANTFQQVNRIMSLPIERRQDIIHTPHLHGHIRIDNLGLRYPSETHPTLQGITLEAHPGEIIAIVGHNGSGKSTLIKLLLGLYEPQVGSIAIDGIDIRRFDPAGLRQAIAYVPQHNQFFHDFHATIAQNMRLAAPDATEKQLMKAIEMAGLLSDIFNLPKGLDTPLCHTPHSGFLQKLNLARAYVKESQILLLDEPGYTFDRDGDAYLKSTLSQIKQKSSIIIATHRPDLMQLADHILVLQNGNMRFFGPRENILKILNDPLKSSTSSMLSRTGE